MANPAPTKKAAPKASSNELLKDDEAPVKVEAPRVDLEEDVQVIACKEGNYGKRRHLGEKFYAKRKFLVERTLDDGRKVKPCSWFYEAGTDEAERALQEAKDLAD